MVRQFFTAYMPLSHLPINWENVLRNKKGRMGLKHEFTLSSHRRILTSFPENSSFIEVSILRYQNWQSYFYVAYSPIISSKIFGLLEC